MIPIRDIIAQQHVLSAVAYVEVKTSKQDIGIGTAFHIGSGYFVTARHVIKDNEIIKVGQSDLSLRTIIDQDGSTRTRTTHPEFEQLGREIQRFEHPTADVAIIQLTGMLGQRGPAATLLPAIELARHADVLTEGELLMTSVKVFGYPPIPYANNLKPALVVSPGEISAVFTNRRDNRRHFVISGLARAGFSGGPVFLTGSPRVDGPANPLRQYSSTAIGVVVESLESRTSSGESSKNDPSTAESSKNEPPPVESRNDEPKFEPGFLDAISIETVHEIIATCNLPLRLGTWGPTCWQPVESPPSP